MKAHLTERYVKGLQPKAKNIIVYDEEVVGFGVRITSGGTRAFILTYRIEARERRLAAETVADVLARLMGGGAIERTLFDAKTKTYGLRIVPLDERDLRSERRRNPEPKEAFE